MPVCEGVLELVEILKWLPYKRKKEKRVRKEGPFMKKKIIRIGTKRKPKPTKKERFLTGDIQTCEFRFKPQLNTLRLFSSKNLTPME